MKAHLRCLLVLSLACGLPLPSLAADAARSMEMAVVVAAPLEETWDLFTTKEGIESWMVPAAEVDWRVDAARTEAVDGLIRWARSGRE